MTEAQINMARMDESHTIMAAIVSKNTNAWIPFSSTTARK